MEMISEHKRRRSCDVGLAPVTLDRRALLSSVLEPDHSLESSAAWAWSAEQSAFSIALRSRKTASVRFA